MCLLHPNVLVPQLRMGGDEIAHELYAGGVLNDFQLDALGAQVVFRSFEGAVFSDDYAGNFVKQSSPTAHRAG